MASYNVTYHNVQGSVTSPLNAMYIDQSPAAVDLLRIEMACIPGWQQITLQGQDRASKDNYHFTVFFQPGVLSHAGDIALAADQVNDWDACVVALPTGTTLYLLRKTALTLAPGDNFTVNLQKVGALPETGPRQTTLKFTWAPDIAKKDSDGLVQQPSELQIINFERKYVPPLSVGFDTTNMVLCDGSYPNVLVLRIVNLGSYAIELDSTQCKLTLSFDTSTDTNQLWALATPNQAKSFYLPGKLDSSAVDGGWSGHGAWNVTPADDPVEWHLTPTAANTALAAGSSLEIPISNIITEHPTGRSLLRVQYQGFQEYDDGQFTVEIQKTPLIYSQYGRPVQICDEVLGYSHINTGVELATWVTHESGGLGTFSGHPLQLYAGLDEKPWLTLTTDGKLGIGTTTPAATLDVSGDAAVSGRLDVSGKLGVGGDAAVGGVLEFGQHARQMLALWGTEHGIGVQGSTTYFRSSGDFGFYKGGVHSDAELNPGGGLAMMVIKNGSVGIGTTTPSATLDVRGNTTVSGNSNVSGALGFGSNTRQMIDLWGSGYGIGVQANTLYLRSGYDFAFFSGGTHSSNQLDPGGGTMPMVIKKNGQVLINGQPPMVIKYFHWSGQDPGIDTKVSSRDWFACIVGFNGLGGAPVFGLNVWANDEGGRWVLRPRVRDDPGFHFEHHLDLDWSLTVLFVRKELCTVQT